MPPPNGSVASTKNNVGVARQLKMLESIIQDEPIDSVPGKDFAVLVAIGADADLNFSGKPLPQQRDFIALRQPCARRTRRRSRDSRASELPFVFPSPASRSAIHSTMGVLPVPPTVRFPTLITVPGNRRVWKMPRA